MPAEANWVWASIAENYMLFIHRKTAPVPLFARWKLFWFAFRLGMPFEMPRRNCVQSHFKNKFTFRHHFGAHIIYRLAWRLFGVIEPRYKLALTHAGKYLTYGSNLERQSDGIFDFVWMFVPSARSCRHLRSTPFVQNGQRIQYLARITVWEISARHYVNLVSSINKWPVIHKTVFQPDACAAVRVETNQTKFSWVRKRLSKTKFIKFTGSNIKLAETWTQIGLFFFET